MASAPMALSQGTFFVVAQYTGSDDPPPESVAVQVTVWTKAQLTVSFPTAMSVEASNGFGDGPGQTGSGGAITLQSNGTHVVTVPIGSDGSGRLGIPVSVRAEGAGSNISNVALATAYFKIDGVVVP